jgi:hypothetical protein
MKALHKLAIKRNLALLLLIAVAILIAAASRADKSTMDKVKSAAEATGRPVAPVAAGGKAAPGDLDLARLRRESASDGPANAFASVSWYVPPPPPPPPPQTKPQPPAPPTAPPLPFTCLGRYQEAEEAIVFLVKGDLVLAVKEGDVIEDLYRIDGIQGATLSLTYLPLNIKQTINIGDGE